MPSHVWCCRCRFPILFFTLLLISSYDIYLHWDLFFHFIIPLAFVCVLNRVQFWWRVWQLAIVAWCLWTAITLHSTQSISSHRTADFYPGCAFSRHTSDKQARVFRVCVARSQCHAYAICMRKHFLVAALHTANGFFLADRIRRESSNRYTIRI